MTALPWTRFGGHGYAKNESAVTALAIKGGCDMDCGVTYVNGIQAAVANGWLKESDLDTAIARAFAMRMRLGMFDEHVPYRDVGKYGRAAMDSLEAKALALQASHGRRCHLDTPYYTLYGKSLMKYNKGRLNDSIAHGYGRLPRSRSSCWRTRPTRRCSRCGRPRARRWRSESLARHRTIRTR